LAIKKQGVFGMKFSDFGSRTVFAAFDGGEITSDAGVLLLRERAKQIKLLTVWPPASKITGTRNE